ncbi:hypothetical protein AVEN_177474-1 [Araneus ventricosus]|uniref:Uncharacterized protein n=1 Tax=Araneus ventricosus TaxID=182803 RepID=A0A4Y2LSK8_ARAVE|nr:hypothetical protein AVEN_177474-1 [Araneus ventricosus]
MDSHIFEPGSNEEPQCTLGLCMKYPPHHPLEAIVNGRAQGRTLHELGKQFNISESGMLKFLKIWVDKEGVPKVPKSGRLVLRLVFWTGTSYVFHVSIPA